MLTKPSWYFLLRLLMAGKQMNYSAAFSGIFKWILCFMPVGYIWSLLIFTLMQWSLVAILYSNLYNASYLADLRGWFWTLLTKWLWQEVCFYNTIKIYYFPLWNTLEVLTWNPALRLRIKNSPVLPLQSRGELFRIVLYSHGTVVFLRYCFDME